MSTLILFLGWAMYWLIKANTERQEKPATWHPVTFLENNVLEFIISIFSCVLIVTVNDPPNVTTSAGKAAIAFTGYSATSIVKNMLVFMNKKTGSND